jgi:hypothetical protein
VLIGIKNAQSPSEIWSVAGTYGEDPEMAMRREQFGEEMKLAWSKHEWDRWATVEQMRLSQMAKSGEIAEKEAQKEIAQVQAQQEAGNILSSLSSIASNTLGMNAMTGATSGMMSQVGGFFRGALAGAATGAGIGAIAGAPVAGVGAIPSALAFGTAGLIGGGFAGRKKVAEAQTSFANDMDFVTSGNIINKLKDIRASGSWSGPMTDRDIEIIGQASNKLNAMWDKENRQFKGTTNKDEASAEIAKIQDAMSRIIVPQSKDDELSKIFK